jgi:outer membrane immunogenic protein
MKRLIFGMIAALAFTASAMAADNFPYSKVPAYGPASYDWTGFYLGAHAGYGTGTIQDVNNPGAAKQSPEGGFGGLQAGYNYQLGRVVVGVEADASFGDISKSWGGANQFDPYYGKDGENYFGTVRGRIGYAFDRFLPYFTGGFAWGNQQHGFGCDANRVTSTTGCQKKKGGSAFYVNADDLATGYTIGGGLEYALYRNWSIKAEYLYTDYGTSKINMVDPNYPTKSLRDFSDKFHTVKIGANYKF